MYKRPSAAKIHIPTAPLTPWPLPAGAILSGTPDAAGHVLCKSDDARSVRGLWACTPGIFRWSWDYDETIFMLSGRATVVLDDGSEVELAPSDFAYFERGQSSVWYIHEDLRKAFHAASPEPLPF